MITKYANLERILEVRSSKSRLGFTESESDNQRFAKFAGLNKGIREEDGYLYVRCRAISSRVNKNNDGWPSEELSKSYKTFENRPIFVDHNNDNPNRTRGIIVASDLHVEDKEKVSALDQYYSSAPDNHLPPTWIELLLEVDAKTFPKLAKAVKEKRVDAVSMGANIDTSICSVCAHEAATPSEYCSHVKKKGSTFEITSDNGEKVHKKAYEDCYGINFFEISFVFDPADPTADVLDKQATTKSSSEECEHCSHSKYDHQDGRGPCEEAGCHCERFSESRESSFQLAEMVGQTLSPERLAQLKQSIPSAEQFMAPKGQGQNDQPKNRNYIPQEDLVTAPQHVDTLRNDEVCPVCHASEMETGADGIMTCPICGHVQEPEPLNNPDLSLAQDNQLREDQAQPGQPVTPVNADPLDAVEFDHEQSQISQPTSTTKRKYTPKGISDNAMFETKLRTTSKEEADKMLPAKVARIETKLGSGIHRGIYDAAREAGLKVKVAYPAVKSSSENTVEVPGDNGIFNLFYAEESAMNLNVPMKDVPVVIEAASEKDAQAFLKILTETALPTRKVRAGNDKQPILPGSKPTDEPKKEKIISNPTQPVEAALKEAIELSDGVVEIDGNKYKLNLVTDEVEDDEVKEVEADESKEDEKEDTSKEVEDTKEEEKDDEDRESRLLAAFKLADMSVEMGLVTPENKMTLIAELEDENLGQLDVREKTLIAVKNAGLSKRTASSVHGIKRVPRLSHAVPALNGSTSTPKEDVPLEALFL